MAALDTAALTEALKQALPSKRLMYVGYQGNPLLAMIPKDTGFGGDIYRVPIWYGGNQGVSATFSHAQANKTGGLYESFKLTTVKKYGLTSIETEAMLASNKDAYAFIKATVAEVDQTTRNVANDIGMGLYRNKGGARGRIASGSASTTLQLTNVEDIVNFHVGMQIVSDDTDGSAGGSDDGEALTISAVDLDAGTITKTGGNWNANGNFSASDYLFREGDYGACLSGLDAWLPSSAPGATTFFDVDRSVDVVRLGGMRYNGASETIDEALQSACARLEREGATPDVVMMNHKDLSALRKSLNHRLEYEDIKATSEVPITFKSLVLPGVGKGGALRLVADRNCPEHTAYILQLDSWVFATRGAAPQMLSGMGQGPVIWDYNADSLEVRIGFYGQLGCFAPGYNCRVTLAS